MKKGIISLLLLLISISFIACAQQNNAKTSQSSSVTNTEQTKVIEHVDVETFAKLKAELKDAILLDVRTPQEYAQGHIPGAKNINIYGNFEQEVQKLDKEKPVLVYCRSGHRSSIAADKLAKMGFKKVYNMKGGIMAWQSAGKEIER